MALLSPDGEHGATVDPTPGPFDPNILLNPTPAGLFRGSQAAANVLAMDALSRGRASGEFYVRQDYPIRTGSERTYPYLFIRSAFLGFVKLFLAQTFEVNGERKGR